MDTAYAGQLLLSILIFAPGLVVLAAFGFVGLMLAGERAGLFGTQQVALAGANPAAGDIVTSLKDATRTVDAEDDDEARHG